MKPLLSGYIIAVFWLAACSANAQHWAFKPAVRPAVPKVKQSAWVRNPIDCFVLRKLESRGLAPSPSADKPTLLRRVTVDLTGLPPTPGEIAAFLADTSPTAYEKVVKRLLSSRTFGERWAQHWLDVVRFAESNGYEHDLDRPQAWRYRDWVVDSLNADKPYDQFLREQVAGDLLAPDDFRMRTATGFLRTGPFHITGGNLDPIEMRQEWLTETVAGIGNGILGLTIGCARCHDHKFDPIPQKDYYRLQAFFAAVANQDKLRATDDEKKKLDDGVKAVKEKMKPLEALVSTIEKPYREQLREQKRLQLAAEYREALAVEASKRTAEQRKLAGEAGTQLNISWDEVVSVLKPEDRARRGALRRQIFALEREMPSALPQAEGVGDVLSPTPAMHLLLRGDVHNPGPVVSPGLPACVSGEQMQQQAAPENPRLGLARWLSSPENPLTARVFVNRVWHYLFGKGLVSTPNDFGHNGQPPSHPELLDWLATTFTSSKTEALDTPYQRPMKTSLPQNWGSGGRIVSLLQNSRPGSGTSSLRQDLGAGGGAAGRGWSIKSIVGLIVTSNTYRQACRFDSARAAIDPENRLLWRMNRKRLDAEALRDSVLAAEGTLNLQIGGPSVRIPLEPEVYDTIFTESEPDNLWPETQDAGQYNRRSLYLFRKRNVRLPMMALFDQPDMMSSCAARGQTVHALQALTLVNSGFMRTQSFLLAKRLFAEAPDSNRGRIDRLFLLTLGRLPHAGEGRATERFLADQTMIIRGRIAHKEAIPTPKDLMPGRDRASVLALSDLCLATLNLNEFIYLR